MQPLAALAEIGRRSIMPVDFGVALQDTVEIAAETLAVPHATILELEAGGEDVRLRAGVGWAQGAIGHTVDSMPGGYVAFTLTSADPVVVDDLATETRFAASPVLEDLGVRSSAAVLIPGLDGRPFGVVGMHRTEHRPFQPEEIAFAAGVATILTSVIARHRHAIEINDDVFQALVVAHYALQLGRPNALEMLGEAIARTRALVSQMLGEDAGAALPGDLRRAGAADVTPGER